MDEIEIGIGKRRLIEFAFLRPDGTPGRIDGPPEIETTEPSVIVPLDNHDQRSFYARCVGAGVAQVIVRADADLGVGVKLIEKALSFSGVDVMANQVQTTIGEEETDPDFDGENHTDPLPGDGEEPPPVSTEPAPEPSDPAGGGVPSGTGEPPPTGSSTDTGGTAPPSGAGDAGPTPPAPGDAGAAQEAPQGGGEGPQVGTAPAAGT